MEDPGVDSSHDDVDTTAVKGRGRLRICKQCKFTCTDSIEFLQHQTKAHGEGEEKEGKKAAAKLIIIKKRTSRSESEISVESAPSEKMNGEEMSAMSSMMDMPMEDHEDDRLVIADDGAMNDESATTPTRCGNIQNRTYVCNVCEFTSTSAKTYLHHQKDEHKYDFTIYECDICEYATKYKQKLPRHRKLHFSGQDGMLLAGGALDDTMNSSLHNHSQDDELLGEEDEEEGMGMMEEMEEMEETITVIPQPVPELPFMVEKKKKTRQEVDPAKYFEVVDDTGIKYACSSCGNVYKWRKSLNKHWKEKHGGEVPDGSKKPPGLMYLVNSGNHTMFGKRRIYSNSVLQSMQQPPTNLQTTPKPTAIAPAPRVVRAETPISMGSLLNGPSPVPAHSEYESPSSSQPVVFPKFIGPFVNNTSSPAYATNHTSIEEYVQAHIKRQKEEVEKRTQHRSPQTAAPGSQDSPLDFSVRKDDNPTLDPNFFKIKMEPLWMGDEDNSKNDSLLDDSQNKSNSAILQCTKCDFVAKTLIDYSSHMTLHLNRRAFKCAVCQEHFNGVEDLNRHFLDEHREKIQEHKNAIQKIPHGLQQTYHLLKMPLDAITHLSSQDLTSTDTKQLKCNMCDFVAKWPAELQKHAVSHSEERPFMCMVCGSTYKWKWDLVKHFEKSHHTLPNPYKRREAFSGGNKSNTNENNNDKSLYSHDEDEHMGFDEPLSKRRRMSDSDMPELIPQQRDDDHIGVFDENRDLGINRKYLDVPSLYAERPSSVPTKFDSFNDSSNEENNNFSHMRISDIQSLTEDEEAMLFKFDSESRIKRPVTEETQKAIAATVRQRLTLTENQKAILADLDPKDVSQSCANILLPYKCPKCEYRARWPSEITQHMKNHSDEKPYHCPRCNYRSKWKWDVVKHLKRCGGGTIKDVIDTSKGTHKRMAPPNVMVLPEGNLQTQTPQPVAYLVSSGNTESNGQGAVIVPILPGQNQGQNQAPPLVPASNSLIQPKPSSNATSLLSKSSNNSQSSKTVFRSLINQGLYHCLECPFVGHSPAELKRHSVLHSENKPFTCGTCGYSSRWKCDLKKHMRTYNHFSAQISTSPGLNGEDSTHTDSDDPERLDKQDQQLFKQQPLDSHMNIHGASSSSPAKFKCKQCSFQVNDLSTFLQHRVSHSNQNAANSGNSSSTPKSEELDDARLKHPRKAVKKLHCSKCEFTCFKRETLDSHEADHEKEIDFKCFYCDKTLTSKDSLLDHISTHSEFNPDEWETFFMEDDQSDEEDDMSMEFRSQEPEKPAKSNMTVDLTVPSPPPLQMFGTSQQRQNNGPIKDPSVGPPQLHIPRSMQNNVQSSRANHLTAVQQHLMSAFKGQQSSAFKSQQSSAFKGQQSVLQSALHSRNIPQQQTSKVNQNQKHEHSNFRNIQPAPQMAMRKRFTCEWCEAMFAHVTTLYQHAKNVHPLELRQQEIAEATRSMVRSQQEKQHEQHLRRQLSQIQQQPAHSTPISTPEQHHKPASISDNKKQFLESLRHILPNDFRTSPSTPKGNIAESISNELMKAKKTTSPQKKIRSFQCTKCPFTAPNAVTYLRHVERHGSNCKHTCWFCDYSIDRLNLLYQHMKGSHSDQWKGSEHEVQFPQGAPPTYPIIVEDDPETMEKIRAENYVISGHQQHQAPPKRTEKPVLILKEQMTWRGVPIQICSIDNKKTYKCPKCSYVNSNIANAANHVRQHGSNRKYQCKYCDYCSDNLKLIYTHMDKVHPKDPAYIEVIRNVEMEHEEDPDEKEGGSVEEGDMEANESEIMTCPKCPFQATIYDIYRAHVMMHSYNGQYKCEHCDYSVDDIAILTRHSVVHEQQKSEKKDGTITPEKKIFTSLLNLKRVGDEDPTAMVKRSPSKSAELASKLLSMQARQTLQKSRLAGRVRYRCSRCPYNTFCKNNIIKHRKQHIVKSRYKCPLCNYSASRAYLLQQHIKFHKTENNTSEDGEDKNYQDVVMDPLDKDNKEFESFDDGKEDGDASQDMDEMEMDAGEDESEKSESEMSKAEAEAVAELEAEQERQEQEQMEENEANPTDVNSSLQTQRLYQCKECPFSSNSVIEFKKHCMFHGAGNRYKCEFCSYSLERLNLLTQHRKLHADEADFDPAPPPSALLNLEVLRFENEKAVAAEKVSSSMENGDHHDSSLQDPDNEPMRYSCMKCPFKSNALKSYNVHVQMHGVKKKYICDYCDWSIDRLNLLYQHRRVHAKQPNFIQNPDEIIILNRDFAIEAPGRFEAQIMHFNKTPEPEPKIKELKESMDKKAHYTCKNCPFSTSNKNSFAYHKMLHRMRARYMCPECSYSVDRWNLLNQHLRLHQEARKQMSEGDKLSQIKCPKCPYLSPSTELLEGHLSMHGAENSFNCHYCDFSVESINRLQHHMKVHEERARSLMSPTGRENGEEMYEANSPDVPNPQLYFSSPDGDNISDDSEETEFKCDRCPFSTTSKDDLDRHDNQHNIPNSFPCCYCDFSCSVEEELKEHIQVHFPGTPVDKEMIKSIITKHRQEKNNNSLTETPTGKTVTKNQNEASAPDSTVEEEQKSQKVVLEEKADVDEKMSASPASRTKVYVCQYCEREFENKTLMMQHERQHLIGHQY